MDRPPSGIMVEAENNVISLFSRRTKKRKKATRDVTAPSAQEEMPNTAAAATSADHDTRAAQESTAGIRHAPAQEEMPIDVEIQDRQLSSRSGATSTSGRTVVDERPTTFRSLGVAEWLDR